MFFMNSGKEYSPPMPAEAISKEAPAEKLGKMSKAPSLYIYR